MLISYIHHDREARCEITPQHCLDFVFDDIQSKWQVHLTIGDRNGCSRCNHGNL